MFRSIRWRLVASYTLMTVLAVTLVGVLALFLIERYLLRQERDYLTMNATAVARQLEPLLRDALPQPALQDLARTTAFLSDVQVRILDAQEQLLVDSGLPSQLDGVTWLLPSTTALSTVPDVTVMPAQPGVFVQILTDQEDKQQVFTWEKAVKLVKGQASPPPPLVVFRRGSDPALWPAPSAPAMPPAEPTGGRPAKPPQAPPTGAPTQPAGAEQRWTGFNTLFAPVASAPQRVVQAIASEQGVLGYVELSSGPDVGAAALTLIRRAFLLAGAGVSLLAMLVALWMSRTLTAPLHELMQVTNQMRSGALSTRAAVRTHDEIGLLATQFNTMATQLERSFAELAAERDALRRFVADASHELRTPITAMKTFTELLLGPAGDAEATRTEFLQENQKQLQRLEWMTSALLKLSRLDAGLTDLKTERLDLRDLLASTRKAFAVRAQAQAIALTLTATPEPMMVIYNAAYLEMALANLLDNALKFTPSGGAIALGATVALTTNVAEVAADGARPYGWAELWVQDNGLGIAPEDRPYIFDRFYRGAPPLVSRPEGAAVNHTAHGLSAHGDWHLSHQSYTAHEEGCGLGLAIVQSIVKAHGGQVTVQSEIGVGSRFVIKLPLAGPLP